MIWLIRIFLKSIIFTNLVNKDIKNQINIDFKLINIENSDKAIKEFGNQISNFKNWGEENIKSIFSKSVEILKDSRNKKLYPIDQLKLNNILDGASKIPAQENQYEYLRILWAKIIAGEVQEPNSISLKTINIIKNIDQNIAEAFDRVASYDKKKNSSIIDFDDYDKHHKTAYNDSCGLEEYGLLRRDGEAELIEHDGCWKERVMPSTQIIQNLWFELTNSGEEIRDIIYPKENKIKN